MIDLDYLKGIRLLLHNGDNGENVWSVSGCLLVLPCPVIKINEKLQPNPDRIRSAPRHFGNKGVVQPLGKEHRSAKVLAQIEEIQNE